MTRSAVVDLAGRAVSLPAAGTHRDALLGIADVAVKGEVVFVVGGGEGDGGHVRTAAMYVQTPRPTAPMIARTVLPMYSDAQI